MNKIPKIDITWLLRYWLGLMMMYHSYWTFFDEGGLTGFAQYLTESGFPKNSSFLLAVVSKSIEFFGGLLLILGIGTRLISFLIMVVMGVAVFYIHEGLILGEGELGFNYFLIAVILFFNPSIPFHLFTTTKPRTNDKK